jgi:hypothetical protein
VPGGETSNGSGCRAFMRSVEIVEDLFGKGKIGFVVHFDPGLFMHGKLYYTDDPVTTIE